MLDTPPRPLPARPPSRPPVPWCTRALALLLPLALLGAGNPPARAKAPAAPAGNWMQNLKQKLAEEAIGTLLNNQLPLKLDADAAYPTVAAPPGGPFRPLPLRLTAGMMEEPLPPGDYVIPALAFCSEYSVHRAGAGVAYEVGPVQGRAAGAIAALLWRGTIEKSRSPRQLQAVSWAIQAGVTYAKMPKTYQAVVDDVIPEYRGQLGGDFFQNLEDLYASHAREAGLPPLEKLLAGLGKPGELALSADRQRKALLLQNTTDERREQVLFAGQESRIAPVKAADGPWTERIPGVAYVRYRVVGGNMAANNEIQLRILPPPEPRLGAASHPRAVFASYRLPEHPVIAAAGAPGAAGSGPTLHDTVFGGIGYSISRAAQALYFVPLAATGGAPPTTGSVGNVTATAGTATLTRDGVTKPLTNGDQIHMGDTLTTGPGGSTSISFADGTQLTLAENAKLTIDDYVYDPANPSTGSASYSWLQGAFVYIGGLIDKNHGATIETPVGSLGFRGTEIIGRYDAKARTVEIDLISGAVAISPKRTKVATIFTAPAMINFTQSEASASPLTPEQYEATKATLFSR